MPVLTNTRHEAFALALAKGTSQYEAYKAAGYRPSHPNATRLTSNEKVKTRVAEILSVAAKQVADAVARPTIIAAINFREEMQILREIVAEARARGDVKTAGDNQRFILTCGGYADSPTLTHEHMSDRQLQPLERQAVADEKPATNGAPSMRFADIFEKIRKH